MRIALSDAVLAPRKNAVQDGIYIYTKELSNALSKNPQAELVPQLTPFANNPMLNYPVNLALSLLGGIPNNWCKPVDLYHVTDYRILKCRNIPTIATLHDAVPLQHPEWVRSKLRRLKNEVMKHSARWINHVIALTNATIPDLVQYWGVKEHQISVVYSGVNSTWFNKVADEQKNEVLKKYGLTPGFFLFVGTLQPRKNVSRIISAFNTLKTDIQLQHPLVIVGRNGWGTEELIPQIQQLQQTGHGYWLDHLPHEDLPALYQSAQALVFPSLNEGFGFPILEAFASDTPVITSNVTSLPEIAGDAAIIVDPTSFEHIAEAMQKLVNDITLRQQLINAGSARAKQFTWETCAAETFKVYQKVLG